MLISLFVSRNEGQQNKVLDLLIKGLRGELVLIVPQVVLLELSYVFESQYHLELDEIASLLDDLVDTPCVKIADRFSWSEVRRSWPAAMGEIEDAMILAVASANEAAALATFDEDLKAHSRTLGVALYW